MPVKVPIGNVLEPRFLMIRDGDDKLETKIISGGQETTVSPVRMEVYSAWVVVSDTGFSPALGDLFRGEVRTFLPTAPRSLRTYPEGSLLARTVTASPAAVALDDDEATFIAIDQAKSVELEPQHFDASHPADADFCLVLRLDFAALNVSIHRFTYHVTLLFSEGEEVQTDPRNISTIPDGTMPE
jgi:hypothetical protein